jgi:hypothetical protein
MEPKPDIPVRDYDRLLRAQERESQTIASLATRMRISHPAGARRAIISFGRKNGKTALSAMLLLLHLCGPEARPNSQLYSAAQSRDQAAILFNLAAKMVRFSPTLAPL